MPIFLNDHSNQGNLVDVLKDKSYLTDPYKNKPRGKGLQQIIAEIKQKQAAEQSSDMIKPKYVQHESVLYKNSSYNKDLLGEK